jgi:hypothetical protein
MSRTVSTTASCKNCGGTVIIEVTGLPDVMPPHTGQTGGIVSKPCPKCYQTSVYSYTIYEHQFRDLR